MSIKASQIADFLNAALSGIDIEIASPASLSENVPDGAVTYSNGLRPLPKHYGVTGRCLILIPEDKAGETPAPYIAVSNPRLAFAQVMQKFFSANKPTGIHKTAHIEDGAAIGARARIGAFVYVGPDVILGADVGLEPHAVVVGRTQIGDGTVIRGHSVIGEPGFGFERDTEGVPQRIPHIGGVIIGRNCEIGALNTIVSGTLEATVIGDHVKTDDHVHIAHNCVIGSRVLIAAAAELSGSVRVGDDVWIGPNASLINGVVVGDNAFIGIGSVITKDVAAETTMGAVRARPLPSGRQEAS